MVQGLGVIDELRGRGARCVPSHKSLTFPPLAFEDRVDEFALPFAFHELVLDKMSFQAHSELLEYAGRAFVPSFKETRYSVKTQLAEGDVEEVTRGLGGISIPLMVRMDDESDLTLFVHLANEVKREVPDQRPAGLQYDGY